MDWYEPHNNLFYICAKDPIDNEDLPPLPIACESALDAIHAWGERLPVLAWSNSTAMMKKLFLVSSLCLLLSTYCNMQLYPSRYWKRQRRNPEPNAH